MVEKDKVELKSSKTDEGKIENENPSVDLRKKSDPNKSESSETSFNDIITYIKDKQEEFNRVLSDYTVFNNKTMVDIIETDDSIILIVDLPRLKKEDVEIAIGEDVVDICAEFEDETFNKNIRYIQRERSYGKIDRSFTLPTKVDFEKAEGTFKNSVLTLKIPKLEKKRLKLKID
jgi:HSP20 family protein